MDNTKRLQRDINYILKYKPEMEKLCLKYKDKKELNRIIDIFTLIDFKKKQIKVDLFSDNRLRFSAVDISRSQRKSLSYVMRK